jgi:membrane protein YqaA with SNARE-associated domain
MWANVAVGAVAFAIIGKLDAHLKDAPPENLLWTCFFLLLLAVAVVSAAIVFTKPVLTALCLVAPQPILILTVCPGNLALVSTFFSVVTVTFGGILGWCIGGAVHLLNQRQKGSSNQASHATSEPAPGADSSALGG